MDWLLIGLAADFSWFSLTGWWAIAQVVIGLGFVIFVHELGHFLVAKACGVKCEKFYVGFDAFDIRIGDRVLVPRALLKWRWGETEYGIGIVPLGGYVKMLGQDDNPNNIEREAQRSRGQQDPPLDGPIDRSQLDPRSYLSKSVPQRMAIISAGVIFNLIFGVIFAAIAFRSGVKYQPPVVSEPLPGSPAWVADVPEGRITRVGGSLLAGEYVTFGDMVQEVALQGTDGPVEVEYVATGSQERETITLSAVKNLLPGIDIPLVGLGQPPLVCRLQAKFPTMVGHAAASAQPPFQPQDEILSIQDQAVSRMSEFKRLLIPIFDQAIAVQVKRHGTGQIETIQVEPNRARTVGFGLQWGPLTAIRENSPAAAAGLKAGDRILKVNGSQPGNLYTFDQRMILEMRAGKSSVELEIESAADGQTTPSSIRSLAVDLEMPQRISEPSGGATALESIGVALSADPIVGYLEPGGDAERGGLKVGDRLIRGRFELSSEFRDHPQFVRNAESFTIGTGRRQWPAGLLFAELQQLPAGTRFDLDVASGDEPSRSLQLTSRVSESEFRTTRGIRPSQLEEIYTAPAWSEAFQVGLRQTWNDGTRILRFLKKLVRGQISATNLGGPATIAAVATSEATEGTSRLLLFLTMLSANLAIVNFLPIPVLDGGHMIFLAYEGIFRRPVTERVQVLLTWAGLIFILGLMAFVLLLDADRLRDWIF